MIVVMVLMISCHVSTLFNKKIVGAHSTTSTTQKVKNVARPDTLAAQPAKRSKNPMRSETSLGMSGGS
jgi:hypothetical protein